MYMYIYVYNWKNILDTLLWWGQRWYIDTMLLFKGFGINLLRSQQMVEVQTFTKCARNCGQMPIFRLTLVFMICLLFVTTEISDLHSLMMLLASPVIYNWAQLFLTIKKSTSQTIEGEMKNAVKMKGKQMCIIYICVCVCIISMYMHVIACVCRKMVIHHQCCD